MPEHIEGAIGVSQWWNHPWWRISDSPHLKGLFIMTMLHLTDAKKLTQVYTSVFQDRLLSAEQIQPESISSSQWRSLLAGMGATPREVEEVLRKLDQQR